jgi:PfaD family protein
VLTGSINQASVEADQSPTVKEMLARAQMADVVMAPAGDMFEMGVEVQVLKRGTLFGVRARKLYEIYRAYPSIEAIPTEVRQKLEKEIFQNNLDEVWQETRNFFEGVDPKEIARAEADPHHKLALVCRWYLGLSSKWSFQWIESRRMDYQIWMGPAQGAFNAWVEGTFLEATQNRTVVQMALNLLEGAAVITRAHQCRTYGIDVPAEAFDFRPRPLR